MGHSPARVHKLTVASLNTQGIPRFGGRLRGRYQVIAEAFEASEVDVVAFQEVFTYVHLWLLTKAMPSFGHVCYRPSFAGPAGGLVTFSRRAVLECRYRRFPAPTAAPDAPWSARAKAVLKGSLLTRLAEPAVCVLTTHPSANRDGDWSDRNRFVALQRGQIADLTALVGESEVPIVVCGDFNVARDSALHHGFMADTGLVDAFAGDCPPTFHREFLEPGRAPQCIDFLLVTAGRIEVSSAGTIFTDKEAIPGGGRGYVSDHVGLRADLGVRSHDEARPRADGAMGTGPGSAAR